MKIEHRPSGSVVLTKLDDGILDRIEIDRANSQVVAQIYFKPGVTTFVGNGVYLKLDDVRKLRADFAPGQYVRLSDYPDLVGAEESVFGGNDRFIQVDPGRLTVCGCGFQLSGSELEMIEKALLGELRPDALPVKLHDPHVTKVEKSQCLSDAVLITSSKSSDCLRLSAAELLALHKFAAGRDVLDDISTASKALADCQRAIMLRDGRIQELNGRILDLVSSSAKSFEAGRAKGIERERALARQVEELEARLSVVRQEGFSSGVSRAVNNLTRVQRSDITREHIGWVMRRAQSNLSALEGQRLAPNSPEEVQRTASLGVASACEFLLRLPQTTEND